MSTHVIVGAGAVGTTTAKLLAARGDRVKLVTRRGTGPAHEAIELVATDATDADRLSALTEGAVALYNCASPQYHQWFTDWPPLGASLLTAAERSGATLTTMSNLYGHQPLTNPITADSPLNATHPKLKLRADMFREAMARHAAGRIKAVEVRASDYIEANSLLSFALGAPLLKGSRAMSPAPLDVPHSFTSIADVAATLATVATDEKAWGRAWIAPTNAPATIRQLGVRFAEVNGAPAAKMIQIPYAVMWTYGLFDPTVRELRTTRYQFNAPFIVDSSETTKVFGLEARPMDEALREVGATLKAAQK
jgi:nucleoside-diphosphate-sugar epimerase